MNATDDLPQIKERTLCKCGQLWDTHIKKDGEVMKRYLTPKHERLGFPPSGFNREDRRRMGWRGKRA